MSAKYPYIRFGFDLVDYEDGLKQLDQFQDLLITTKQELEKKYKRNVEFTLHAGESYEDKNENIYDAIALGTKRIGHGILLFKHPEMLKEVIDQDIIVEV